MKMRSIRTRLFLLVVFSYLFLAVPILIYCTNTLGESALAREKEDVRESCFQLMSVIEERFLYRFEDRVGLARRYRDWFVSLAQTIAPVAMSGERHKELLGECEKALFQQGIHFSYYRAGAGFLLGRTAITGFFTGNFLDSKGRAPRTLLTKGELDANGSMQFCIVSVNTHGLKGSSSHIPILLGFYYMDAERTLVFGIRLREMGEEHFDTLDEIFDGIHERVSRIPLHKGSTLAIVSPQGDTLFQYGEHAAEGMFKALLAKWNGKDKFFEATYDADGKQHFGRIAFLRGLNRCVVASVPMNVVLAPGRRLVLGIALISGLGLVIGLAAVLGLASTLVSPLLTLTGQADRLASLDLNTKDGMESLRSMGREVPVSSSTEEVGRLAAAFSRMASELDRNIAMTIEDVAARKRAEGEIAAARDMQMGILSKPNASTVLLGARIRTYIRPAREVGGDFYDAIPLPDGRVAVVIGDVSGKGVAASLFMAMAVAHVRQALMSGLAPADAMKTVNANLAYNNEALLFVTLFIGLLDVGTGRFEYCNGGHCAPVVCRTFPSSPRNSEGEGSDPVRYLRHLGGPLVGVFMEAEYVSSEDTLEPGECCLLYTDGVTEAMDEASGLFGERGLSEAIREADGPEDAVERVARAVGRHAMGRGQMDDITMICFSREMGGEGMLDAGNEGSLDECGAASQGGVPC